MIEKIGILLERAGKFLKGKKEIPYPNEFALIRLTDVARMKGVDDDENKIIEHFKNGELFKTYPHSKSIIRTLKKEEIPIVSENFEWDEEFEWDEPTEFGKTELRR
jgi:hypothetical protein